MNLGVSTRRTGVEGSFKARAGDTLRKGYATLRNEGPERNLGSFDPSGLYLSLRSPSAYSLPSTSRCASFGRAGRVPFGGLFETSQEMQQVKHTTDKIAAGFPTYRKVSPNVMGGGVECQPPTPDTPGVESATEKARNAQTVVSVLGCQGCQPPKPYYRVGRVYAHMRLFDSSVWTPDSPDGLLNPPPNHNYNGSIRVIGVRGTKHPTPDTGVMGVRGLTQKVLLAGTVPSQFGGGGSGA